MPSLQLLWKTIYFHSETQNRFRSLWANSFFYSKSLFSYTSGEPIASCQATSKFFEVADPGSFLSIPEALTRAVATPSVCGPAWHAFYCNPYQSLIHKNQPARSQGNLGWLPVSSQHGISQVSQRFSLHSSSLNVPTSTLREEAPKLPNISYFPSQQLPKFRWSCELDDKTNNEGASYNLVDHRETCKLQWVLSNSVAFHLIQYGLYQLPVVQQSLQGVIFGLNSDDSAAFQSGFVLDCPTDKGRAEVSDKHEEGSLSSTGLRLLSAACCLPHPEKQETGGEDAFFICSEKHVIGVADGVGGWADMGVDAGEYARQLMNESLIAAQQEPAGCIDTARVMEIAHSKTTCRGSSTACILALSNNGLQAANLGDSGFLVVRNGRLVFKSPAQQHNFNVPFQLENGGGDPPDAAEVFTVDVAVGDVVVAGTDGLFDNLYDSELVSIVVQATRAGLSPEVTAKKIASLAREHAQDCNRQTPFSAAAQDAGFRFYGGKMDDITVVVSYVVKS